MGIARFGTMFPLCRYSIVTSILKGLIEMNHQGLIHCDLKPANLLIHSCASLSSSVKNVLLKVRVADLGMSQRISRTSKCSLDLGSTYYMCPEHVRRRLGGQPFYELEQCDTWAVGCIVGELCYGHYLFHDKHDDEGVRASYVSAQFFREVSNRMRANIELDDKSLELMKLCLFSIPPSGHLHRRFLTS